jgi:hypothetical protein
LISIAGGYLTWLFLHFHAWGSYHTFCPFRLITGIPCPGCGMGRATIALLQGHVAVSLHYNILCIPFTLFILISVLWIVADLIRDKDTFFPFMKRDFGTAFNILIFGIILVDWTLNIVRHI